MRLPSTSIRIAAAVLAVALLVLLAADSGEAKKKKRPFKTGSYVGTTSDLEPIGFIVEKKAVSGLFVDLRPPCYRPDPFFPGGPPSFAGLEAKIKKKKVADIFGPKKRKVGVFEADAPDGESFVKGWIKGRKAKGFVSHIYPGCPYVPEWEAELSP